MSEAQKAARFNITLPADLRARMEAAPSVNWSAVAAEAFKRRLQEVESENLESDRMEDVIKRLKAAEELDSSETRQEGFRAGEAWAKQSARPKQLRLLAKLDTDDAQYSAEDYVGIYCNGMNAGAAIGLWEQLHPTAETQNRLDRREQAREFWEQALGKGGFDQMEDEEFATGFVRGAIDLWGSVEDQL